MNIILIAGHGYETAVQLLPGKGIELESKDQNWPVLGRASKSVSEEVHAHQGLGYFSKIEPSIPQIT